MANVVAVKWNGKLYEDIEFDAEESGLLFKTRLFSLTGIEPERQRIIVKGAILKDTDALGQIGIKAGQTLLLMGTPAANAVSVAPIKKPLQPDSEAEGSKTTDSSSSTDSKSKIKFKMPNGLVNIGNTCYLNSVLQAIFHLSEDPNNPIAECLKDPPHLPTESIHEKDRLRHAILALFAELQKVHDEEKPIIPRDVFLELISAVPQFGETAPLAQAIPGLKAGMGLFPAQQDAEECLNAILNHLPLLKSKFEIQTKETVTCEQHPEIEPECKYTSLFKLQCIISSECTGIEYGIKDFLMTSVEKTSDKFPNDGPMQFKSVSKITNLPQFMQIQISRFGFKSESSTATKILKKISFPFKLDLSDFCTESATAVSKHKPLYGLRSVITHKGRAIDSGHYIAWCRSSDKWIKFDDDKVDIVTEDEVKNLSGGGDWHMSYILMYELQKSE